MWPSSTSKRPKQSRRKREAKASPPSFRHTHSAPERKTGRDEAKDPYLGQPGTPEDLPLGWASSPGPWRRVPKWPHRGAPDGDGKTVSCSGWVGRHCSEVLPLALCRRGHPDLTVLTNQHVRSRRSPTPRTGRTIFMFFQGGRTWRRFGSVSCGTAGGDRKRFIASHPGSSLEQREGPGFGRRQRT